MKKVLAIVAVLMLVPFTAFGMEMMADTALEDVTGQAGVSISIDNVQMDFAMDYLAWGDADGLLNTTTDDVGYVNLTKIQMTNIVIDKLGIGASGIDPIAGEFDVLGTVDEATIQIVVDGVARDMVGTDLGVLTIDVGALYRPAELGGTFVATAVAIGVPTLSIYVGEIAPFDIMLDTDAGNVIDDSELGDGSDTTGWTLGSVAVGGMQCDLKGGTVYIFAH